MRAWVGAAGLVIAWLAGLAGCALTVDSIEIERTVEQNALVPAPTGPRATGPLADRGRPALEVGYSFDPVASSGRSHFQGERGDVVVEHMFRGRVAVGLGEAFELGLHVEVGNARFGHSIAADGQIDAPGRRFGRVGPSVRVLAPVGGRARLGAVFELELASIPFFVEVFERAWKSTTTVAVGHHPWWFDLDRREEFLGQRTLSNRSSVFVPMVRTGLQLGIDLSPRAMLMLGFVGQNVPSFRGASRQTIRCVGDDAITPERCAAAHPIRGPYLRHELVGTVFAALSVRMGHVVALAQLAGHALASQSIQAATPVSLDLGLRYQF
jgi:hypothetical protein